jgi:tetratricopeptide (TPR) repeat protein
LEYLKRAQEFAGAMPVRSKSLMDIYVDIFLNTNYTDGFAKMESYIKNYPDDKEARTIYAAILNIARTDDITPVIAQFDTVLAQDPTYQFALAIYANMMTQQGNYKKADELLGDFLKFYPDSPEPYKALIDLYFSQNLTDKAIDIATQMISKFPDNDKPLRTLVNLYLRKREFDSSAYYNELYHDAIKSDHFSMMAYQRSRGSLLAWRGKFKPALEATRALVDESYLTKDSLQISGSLRFLAGIFYRLEMNDSAVHYAEVAQSYNPNVFSAASYPLMVMAADHDKGVKLKPVFDSIMTAFQAQVPQGMWVIVDGLKALYEGRHNYDTLKVIEGLQTLNSVQQFVNGGNLRSLAQTQVNYGQYAEALETLDKAMTGRYLTVSGYTVPNTLYYLGRAHEGLGHNDEAVAAYKEMLSYWGSADIEIKIIKEARDRLARLTS